MQCAKRVGGQRDGTLDYYYFGRWLSKVRVNVITVMLMSIFTDISVATDNTNANKLTPNLDDSFGNSGNRRHIADTEIALWEDLISC